MLSLDKAHPLALKQVRQSLCTDTSHFCSVCKSLWGTFACIFMLLAHPNFLYICLLFAQFLENVFCLIQIFFYLFWF